MKTLIASDEPEPRPTIGVISGTLRITPLDRDGNPAGPAVVTTGSAECVTVGWQQRVWDVGTGGQPREPYRTTAHVDKAVPELEAGQ